MKTKYMCACLKKYHANMTLTQGYPEPYFYITSKSRKINENMWENDPEDINVKQEESARERALCQLTECF